MWKRKWTFQTYIAAAPNQTYIAAAPNQTCIAAASNQTYIFAAPNQTYIVAAPNQTYIAAAPNQTLTPVFIHSSTGQHHIIHIVLYLILIIVGVGVPEITLLKYRMTSVLDTVLISNTATCSVSRLTSVHCILHLKTQYQNGHMGSEIFFL